MLKSRAIAAVITLAAGLPPTAGRATAPARWPPGSTVLVWIDRNAPSGAAELVERAMKVWTDASGGRLILKRTAAESGAAIRVVFIHPDGVYGMTAPKQDPATGFLVHADVGIVVVSEPDPLDGRIITYLTALHELGHAVGMSHSDDFNDIMYLFRRPDDGERYFGAFRKHVTADQDIGSARAAGLSMRDIELLRALYSH